MEKGEKRKGKQEKKIKNGTTMEERPVGRPRPTRIPRVCVCAHDPPDPCTRPPSSGPPAPAPKISRFSIPLPVPFRSVGEPHARELQTCTFEGPGALKREVVGHRPFARCRTKRRLLRGREEEEGWEERVKIVAGEGRTRANILGGPAGEGSAGGGSGRGGVRGKGKGRVGIQKRRATPEFVRRRSRWGGLGAGMAHFGAQQEHKPIKLFWSDLASPTGQSG